MRWQARALIALVLTCFALFSTAVLFNSSAYKLYQADLQDNRRDCEAERKSEQSKHSKECQSLLYRTLDDPVALLTGALFVATIGLFVVTYGLFTAAMKQGRDAERLFAQEQRPWLQTFIEPAGHLEFDEKGIRIDFIIKVKNIGKTPAYQVAGSKLFLQIGMHNTVEFYDKTRDIVDKVMQSLGDTLLPGEEIVETQKLAIPRAMIEESKNKPSLCSGYLPLCFKYRSEITKQVHETSRMFALNIDGGCPLCYVEDLHDILNRPTTLTRLSALDITT